MHTHTHKRPMNLKIKTLTKQHALLTLTCNLNKFYSGHSQLCVQINTLSTQRQEKLHLNHWSAGGKFIRCIYSLYICLRWRREGEHKRNRACLLEATHTTPSPNHPNHPSHSLYNNTLQRGGESPTTFRAPAVCLNFPHTHTHTVQMSNSIIIKRAAWLNQQQMSVRVRGVVYCSSVLHKEITS